MSKRTAADVEGEESEFRVAGLAPAVRTQFARGRAFWRDAVDAAIRAGATDTELNVTLDDAAAVKAFRHRLWARDLGVDETTVAGWGVSDFFLQWDLVAWSNERLAPMPQLRQGESVVHFDPRTKPGVMNLIPDVLTET